MTRHDLVANPNSRMRMTYPFLVLLQASVVGDETHMVAPLAAVSPRTPHIRLLPIVDHEGARYAVMLGLISHLSGRLLRHPVGSIAHYRDDLTRALDWLFFGI